MFGAIYGDVIGAYYEVHCTKDPDFPFHRESTFTDDSELTAAVCRAILNNPADISRLSVRRRGLEYAAQYRQYYRCFPDAGYGQLFLSRAKANVFPRQKSYANGASMRAVPIGYAYSSLKQALLQAKASCYYTHHPGSRCRGAGGHCSSLDGASRRK